MGESVRFAVPTALGVLATTLSLATPAAPAAAAVPTGPTAVTVGPNGITYLGTADGGSLQRIDATGATLSPLPLPRSGPVDGLDVDADGHLWVSTGAGASELNAATGAELRWIEYGVNVPDSCPATDADDPSEYGGIEAARDYLYVAYRCGTGSSVGRIEYSDGTQRGGVSPLGGRVRGLAFGPVGGGLAGNGLYLALPDRPEVLVYPPVTASNGGLPLRTIEITAVAGGVTPRPSGVAVDDQGTLFVADSANHAVYVYDRNGTYQRYIGKPPNASTADGGFDTPTALAQYPRSGSIAALQGNLFVADTGNDRVQRLDTYGYFFWSADSDGSSTAPGSAPLNTSSPTVRGNPNVGETLTCDPGEWAGDPTFEYGWNRNNSYLPEEKSSTYVVRSGDVSKRISCYVRGRNDFGTSDYATSANVTIGSGPVTPSAPANATRPTISGTAENGGVLTCGNGSWTGSPAPTFTRQWQRDGVAIDGATATTYTVTSDDVGRALTCAVTGTNSQGSATAVSPAVTPVETAPPSPCAGRRVGVSIADAATYTRTATVSLRIVPPAGATQVLISNDGGFESAEVRPVSADCTYPWTLPSDQTRVTKNVYVRFAGGGVSEDNQLGDDIVYDPTAPRLAAPRIAKASAGYTVRLSARDAISGVARVQHGATRSTSAPVTAYRARFTTRQPASFAWVRVFDGAGNPSPWVRAVRR